MGWQIHFNHFWENICQIPQVWITIICITIILLSKNIILWKKWRRPSRQWTGKTWRSPSSPQIHQKYIYVWNNCYRTPTEPWQKTSNFSKGKKLPTYLGRAKEKRKNRDKRIGMGPAPLGGSCEGGKVSTH